VPLFGQDRGALRAVWREAWRKHRAGLPLEPLEAQLADLVEAHPEYHAALEDGDPDRDWTPEQGESNPFLHLGLHAAVRDGLATDRPAGLRAAYLRVAARCRDTHEAEHVLLECLGETLWEAQRSGAPPDEQAWLERVLQRVAR
jgi:hypothetical protein